ncbi:MAG: NAD(P)H-hydrate dehydratase [Bacteroidales bacterium]
MKLFLTKDIKEIDAQTIKEEGITSIELMERAAGAVADEIMARWSIRTPIVLFAGPGNNGGDALAVARLLTEGGYKTETYLFNPKLKLSSECQKNKTALESTPNAICHEVTKEFVPPTLTADTLVIDGLFGSGLNAPVTGGFAAVIQYINSSESKVVSIDIPSGLFGEDNDKNDSRNIVRATLTLTFQFPKLSFMFPESEKFTGEVVILDINLSQQAMANIPSPFHLTERYDVTGLLNRRAKFAHKGNFGHALLAAGSYGMMGAAVLAAKACMNSGVGLLTVHAPESGYIILQTAVPEAKFQADKNPKFITRVNDILNYTATGFGPGIGTDSNTVWAVKEMIKELRRPCVIDADGLNILAQNPELLSELPSNSILTPHPKEFERLFGKSDNSFDRLMKGMEAAMKYNVIIVLKGADSAVILPTGHVHFNSSGNPGMATAGCGDVLTGILLALLSQNYRPDQAAVLGVYLHGMAADIAVTLSSEEALTAGDIVQNLGHAFRQLRLS